MCSASGDGSSVDRGMCGSAHLLRFGSALTILVGVSLAGVALEQRSLQIGRDLSLQTFRADRLKEEANRLRVKIEELQTPQRLREALKGEAGPAATAEREQGGLRR
jgi:hypothetical protein